MNPDDARLLVDLLDRRVLSLGVLLDGKPYVGLLPFATALDHKTLYVHASSLARHTPGLGDGMPFSALVHAPEDGVADPLQVPRVTLQGIVQRLAPGSPEHQEARGLYLARFPDSTTTFELADFSLYALRVAGGRLVAGFARARNVSPGDLATLRR